ncbi:hypothetical protein D3C85_1562530 [compost metagenome]
MLAAEQLERAGDVGVEGVLHALAFPVAPVEEGTFASDRVGVAAAGGAEQGVVLVAHLVQVDL